MHSTNTAIGSHVHTSIVCHQPQLVNVYSNLFPGSPGCILYGAVCEPNVSQLLCQLPCPAMFEQRSRGGQEYFIGQVSFVAWWNLMLTHSTFHCGVSTEFYSLYTALQVMLSNYCHLYNAIIPFTTIISLLLCWLVSRYNMYNKNVT